MVQLFLDNLSKNVYMVSSLYIRQVVCNLNIQHDQGTFYSQSASHKATRGEMRCTGTSLKYYTILKTTKK